MEKLKELKDKGYDFLLDIGITFMPVKSVAKVTLTERTVIRRASKAEESVKPEIHCYAVVAKWKTDKDKIVIDYCGAYDVDHENKVVFFNRIDEAPDVINTDQMPDKLEVVTLKQKFIEEPIVVYSDTTPEGLKDGEN